MLVVVLTNAPFDILFPWFHHVLKKHFYYYVVSYLSIYNIKIKINLPNSFLHLKYTNLENVQFILKSSYAAYYFPIVLQIYSFPTS